jgi:hypothetical protein
MLGADGLRASGRLGFIGVDVKSATVAFDQDVALNFKLVEPGVPDQKIRLHELGAPGIMTFSVAEDAGQTDLVVVAEVGVSAVLPGLPDAALPIADATVTFTWADMSDPVNLTLTGPGGVDLTRFVTFSAADLVGQMQQLEAQLGSLVANVDVDIPFVSVSLDGLVDVLDFVDDNLLARITTHLPNGRCRGSPQASRRR